LPTTAFVPALARSVELIAANGDVSNGNRRYAWIDGDRDTLWPRLLAGDGVMHGDSFLSACLTARFLRSVFGLIRSDIVST